MRGRSLARARPCSCVCVRVDVDVDSKLRIYFFLLAYKRIYAQCAHALVSNCIVAIEFGIKTLFIFIHTIVVDAPACFLAHKNRRGGEREGEGNGNEGKLTHHGHHPLC